MEEVPCKFITNEKGISRVLQKNFLEKLKMSMIAKGNNKLNSAFDYP
jgi:hypothetical protein